MGSTQSRRYSSSSDFSDSSGTITPEIKTHSSHPLPNALILDLGDVLFTWSLPTLPTLSPSVFKKITRSSIWFEYEKGNLTEHDAYAAVAEEFCVTPSAVAEAFQQARESLKPNLEFLALVMQLKKEHGLKVFAMSNISAPDWEFLRNQATPEQWAVFDRVFTSAEMGERKPNLGFYRRVLEAAGVDPERTVFVDDKPENVLSARSLGVKGVVFTNSRDVGRELKNFFGDPAARAKEWLRCNAGKMQSVTNSGVVLEENFAQFMIWEITGNRELVDVGRWARLVCFFKGDGVLTTAEFPCDLDTTSIAMTVAGAEVEEEMKNSVMDEMLTYKNKDDIIQTYFDVSRPRIDPVVATNVLTFFYANSRGHELSTTLDWVYSVLLHEAYIDGTMYYYSPDAFLYFLSRLLPFVFERFASLFAKRCRERIGVDGDALALAMRVVAASAVGIEDRVDLDALLKMQEEDGAFPTGWVYKYGGSGILIGNRGLTTSMAVQAVESVELMDTMTGNHAYI